MFVEEKLVSKIQDAGCDSVIKIIEAIWTILNMIKIVTLVQSSLVVAGKLNCSEDTFSLNLLIDLACSEFKYFNLAQPKEPKAVVCIEK